MRPSVAYRTIGLAAALIVAALVVHQLMTLVLAVVVTIIVALPLSAAASLAERHRLPRAVGAAAALVAGFGVVVGLGFAVIPSFVAQAKQFASRLPALVANVERHLPGSHGVKPTNLSTQISHALSGYLDHPQQLIGPIEQVGLTAAGVAILLALIVLVAFLIAVNPTALVQGLLRLLPAERRPQAQEVLGRIRTAWLGWMTAVGIDMVVLGSLLFIGMKAIGLNFAVGFAVFSALMTVIPNYGSVISAIPPILDGLAQSPTMALLVLIVYLVVNQIEGNVLLPLIMARTVDMHPAVVSIGLLLMAALFGIIGVLIAIPLLSLAIILVQALWIEPQEARAAAASAPTTSSATG